MEAADAVDGALWARIFHWRTVIRPSPRRLLLETTARRTSDRSMSEENCAGNAQFNVGVPR